MGVRCDILAKDRALRGRSAFEASKAEIERRLAADLACVESIFAVKVN